MRYARCPCAQPSAPVSKTLARRTAVFGWIVLVIGHEGLKFHDGEPVLSKDVVASINRWAARDSMGQMIKTTENELVATDDRTFRWSLKKPYPKILLALGKIGTPCCFVMPARIAATDPYKQINEYVGSGPMRFVKEEWTPGAKAVFEKVADYRPRAEPASWLAGGKRIASDRIEWIIIADQATAAAALQNGEVDWLELPLPDIVPVLRRNRNITIDVADPMGCIGTLFFNHLYPPFNDVRARRAVLMALNQEDYMRAYVGSDDAMWKPLPSYFTPGSALYNEEGGDVLKGRRNLDAAKRLLGRARYVHGCTGHCRTQSLGRRHGGPADAPRRQGRLRRRGLGHRGCAQGPEIAAWPRWLADFPHLLVRGRLRRPDQQDHSRERRQGIFRVAERPANRSRGRRLVRSQYTR